MWDTIWRIGDSMLRYTGHLDRDEWLMVLAGVTAVGFFCMRGFGSRNRY